MRRKGTLLLGVAAASALWGPLAAQQREECGGGVRTALVLSGGGAKGIAHIEVIRALDSLGARPDFIVGTSMGAIIGALYASGYSGRAIDSIARAGRPRQLFENREPRTPHAWLPMAPQLIWEQGTGGFSLQSPTVREPEANAALSAMLLRGNLLARGNFDSLPIPFRAVATDLETRAPVLLARGDLAQSVRASIAVPLVFPPQRIAGKVLTDGGLSANVPIGLARRLGADRVIVSDVGGRLLHADELTNPLAVADQLVTFLFQQQADTLGAGDVYIKTDVEGFSTLDFSDKAMDSLRINGRRAADSVLARAGCLPRAPLIPGAVPRHTGPFSVEGIRRAEGAVLEEILGLRPGSALSEEELRRRLAGLPTMEQYKAVWLNPGGSADEASFRLAVEPASRRLAGAAFAYDNTLSGRLGVAYIDQRFLGIPLEASGRLALSPLHDDFGFGFRRYFGVGRSRLAPTLTGYLSRERIIRYDADGEELGRPLTREGVLFAGLQRDFGSDWILNLGFDGRIWRDADTLGSQTMNGLTGQSGGLLFRAMHQPGSAFVLVEAVWSGNFRRLQTDLDVDLRSGKLTVTPRARLGWGEFLPLQSTFPLGGDDGFPGLNIHERRGDREAMVSLQGTWMLEGPLSLRMLLAAGRSAYGGGLFSGDDWLGGLRAGLGVETPVGPVRAEYGFATNGRSSLLLRIGRWF